MTRPTSPPILAASNPQDLLLALKDLKNGVIGNTWRKVETAENESVLKFLLDLLAPRPINADRVELIIETSVIIGALGNVGPLTMRPLLAADTPSSLLAIIRQIAGPSSSVDLAVQGRLVPPLLKALRNVLLTTADLVWGHMWGVGAEKKVISTGLVGPDSGAEYDLKGKGVAGRSRNWRVDGARALGMCFEQANLACLMGLVQRHQDNQVILPLYQLLSRLVALPSHREALSRWSPGTTSSAEIGLPQSLATPFILDHLLFTISVNGRTAADRKLHAKLLEASMDLLAAVVKGQPRLASEIRAWKMPHAAGEGGQVVEWMTTMLSSGPKAVRIAATNCLTNIVKADTPQHPTKRARWNVLSMQLLTCISSLFRTEGMEDRVRLCFILAALVSDNMDLQRLAMEEGLPMLSIDMAQALEREEEKGEIGFDLASRCREAILLAVASLCFTHEPTRALLADSNPPFLPFLLQSLSHASYGVRAAACQLARALSRTIAILRTNLVDSGIGKEVIATLKREVESHARQGDVEEDESDERSYTVEVAAMATMCNLIADFSPLRDALLSDGTLDLICELSRSPHEPLALNALWALKNLTFRAEDRTKGLVMQHFGWKNVKTLVEAPTPMTLRVQGLEIIQNILADSIPNDITRYFSYLEESSFLDILVAAAREGQNEELRIPALFVLSNLALGSERVRQHMPQHAEVFEVISNALNAKSDMIKIPAIRALRNLVEASARTHKPRPAMLEALQPYQLRPRLAHIAETSPNLEACRSAMNLLSVIDKGGPTSASAAGGAVQA